MLLANDHGQALNDAHHRRALELAAMPELARSVGSDTGKGTAYGDDLRLAIDALMSGDDVEARQRAMDSLSDCLEEIFQAAKKMTPWVTDAELQKAAELATSIIGPPGESQKLQVLQAFLFTGMGALFHLKALAARHDAWMQPVANSQQSA